MDKRDTGQRKQCCSWLMRSRIILLWHDLLLDLAYSRTEVLFFIVVVVIVHHLFDLALPRDGRCTLLLVIKNGFLFREHVRSCSVENCRELGFDDSRCNFLFGDLVCLKASTKWGWSTFKGLWEDSVIPFRTLYDGWRRCVNDNSLFCVVRIRPCPHDDVLHCVADVEHTTSWNGISGENAFRRRLE